MWTCVVDGHVYGFFESEEQATNWAKSPDGFPVAYAQGLVKVLEFVSI